MRYGKSKAPRVRYPFYEEPMNSETVLLRNTAMGWNSLRASLSQGTTQRLLYTDDTLPQEIIVEILDNFDGKLIKSGYNRDERIQILESGVAAYENKKQEQ